MISPLESGKKYFVNFKVSRIDRFVYCAHDKMGALFSIVSYSLGNDSCNNVQGLLPNNFAHVYSNQIMTDTANWTTVTGSFIADSAYQYIIIGNHFDDNNTNTICLDSNMGAHYLIDNIYVSTDSVNGIKQSNMEQSVVVYPTVSSDIVFIQINIPSKANIKIYDLLGRLITTQTVLPFEQNRISIQEYDAGIYIVSVDIDNKIITKKIIITK
ncbi:MAG: T9SS type A sorting domain-containing protein [Bacteroidetes bacterium]|nr:T9SS type A sorting domain-containing protein [Bacteroidota bacterium]